MRTIMANLRLVLAACLLLAGNGGNMSFAQKKLSAHTAMAVQVHADEIVPAYINVNRSALDREAFDRIGVRVTLEVDDILTARVPMSALAALAEVEGVEYVQVASAAKPMLDIARVATYGAAMNAGSGLDMPYTGKGVVVGIVDSGFDYNHAAFRTPEGELRIQRVWEQGTTPGNGQNSPEQFGYGLEMTSPEVIEAAGGDIRGNSHGTHVTCCAAGSSSHADGTLRGMAPDADIVLVSMTSAGTDNVNISNAIAYIFAYADEVDKPCVVNLSLGSQSGPHDGTSTFDVIADKLQGPGRLIVGAAGNHRAEKVHIRRDNIDQTVRTFLDYTSISSANSVGGEVEVWTSGKADVSLVLYKMSTCAEVARGNVDMDSDVAQTVALGRNASGSFTVSAETSPLNGKQHVVLRSAVTAIRSDYVVAVEVTPLDACDVDIWTDNPYIRFASHDKDGFVAPTASDPTVCEIGGTARRILTVGAYTTRAEYQVYGSNSTQSLSETLGDLCSFSGVGPTADGRVKPNVTAPGAYISSAVSQYDNSGSIVHSHVSDDDGVITMYGFMQGTSMSSPIVTGIVAAWLQANPKLTPEDLADVVGKTSTTDEFTTDSRYWGCGKINALAGVRQCLLLADGVERTEAGKGDARIFTVSGMRVDKMTTPGLYIVNGKKVVTRL